MALIGYYGVLATTASIFVGILTAYLVTRLSDLKSERTRLKRRIESIHAEQKVLKARHDYRVDRLEETEDRWEREDAEDDVDNFIEYDVGRNWDPHPDDATFDAAIEALIEHQEISEDDLIHHHVEVLRDRWDEVIDELQPRSIPEIVTNPSTEEYTAANWIIEALWEIYDRERYDSHDVELLGITRRTSELQNKRDVLEDQYESLDPIQLKKGIKATMVPIGLSVVFPLLVRLLHELGWVLTISSKYTFVEPIIVTLAWTIGFIWTLVFVWSRISDDEEELPEPALQDTELLN